MKTIFNILSFYLGWFLAIYGASVEKPLLGPVIIILLFIFHIYFIAEFRKQEITFTLLATVLGSSLDSIPAYLNYIHFNSPSPSIGVYPIWMAALWVGFSTTFSISLKWMQSRYLIGFIFGAIGAPLSYISAEKLSALQITGPRMELFILQGFLWGVIMVLLLLAHHIVLSSITKLD